MKNKIILAIVLTCGLLIGKAQIQQINNGDLYYVVRTRINEVITKVNDLSDEDLASVAYVDDQIEIIAADLAAELGNISGISSSGPIQLNGSFIEIAAPDIEIFGLTKLNGFRIENLGTPVNSKDAANKEYVDTELANIESLSSPGLVEISGEEILIDAFFITVDGRLNMSGNRITSVADPVNLNDGVNKSYVDSEIANISRDNLGLGSNDRVSFDAVIVDNEIYSPSIELTNFNNQSVDAHIYVDQVQNQTGPLIIDSEASTKIESNGVIEIESHTEIVLTGNGVRMDTNIDLQGNKVTNIDTPTDPEDLVNKEYVDELIAELAARISVLENQ